MLPTFKQDRHCTCNVTLRRLRATIVAVQYYVLRVCVCNLSVTCTRAISHLWPARLCRIFQLYLMNGTIFFKKKKLMNTRSGFLFSLQLLPQMLLLLRRIEREI